MSGYSVCLSAIAKDGLWFSRRSLTKSFRDFLLTHQLFAFHHVQEKETNKRPVLRVKVAYPCGGSGSTLHAVPVPRQAHARDCHSPVHATLSVKRRQQRQHRSLPSA